MRIRWASRTQRVDCSGCDSWPFTASCPARIPASLLVTCAGKTDPAGRQRPPPHRYSPRCGAGFFAEVGDDVSVVVNQCQHSRRRGGVDPGFSCRLLTMPSFPHALWSEPGSAAPPPAHCGILQGDVALIVALAALDQQVLDLRVQRRDRLLAGLPVVRTLSRSDCETFCIVLKRW